jgi:hypothetical protein
VQKWVYNLKFLIFYCVLKQKILLAISLNEIKNRAVQSPKELESETREDEEAKRIEFYLSYTINIPADYLQIKKLKKKTIAEISHS